MTSLVPFHRCDRLLMIQTGYYGERLRPLLRLKDVPPSLVTRSIRGVEVAVTETRDDNPEPGLCAALPLGVKNRKFYARKHLARILVNDGFDAAAIRTNVDEARETIPSRGLRRSMRAESSVT
jgi:hypothetical protein